MDTIVLKKNENGETVQVITETNTIEAPLSKDEVKRQIKQHSDIVLRLQATLEAIEKFEAENTEKVTEEVITAVEASSTPLIDPIQLEEIIKVEE